MSLETGTRLGPYEVGASIGHGGMGEVYIATDTRLERTVAIKILSDELAESPERKARFEREAKVVSQLNHPHICVLHDVGEENGIDYLVMGHIEGETLSERLKKGALCVGRIRPGRDLCDAVSWPRTTRAHVKRRRLRAGLVSRW